MTRNRAVMIVSSASPYPRDNGKRVVMNGFIDYFVERSGPEALHYVLVLGRGREPPEVPCKLHVIASPTNAAQVWGVGRHAVLGGRSFQQALLSSRRLRSELHDLIRLTDPALVIYDTVRFGQHALHDHSRRELIYLDDLFSLRYERMLDADASGELGDIDPLGEFGAMLPRPMRWFARRPVVYRKLLRVEEQRLRRSEDASIQSFAASLLLNEDEAALARVRAGSTSVLGIRPYLPEVGTHMRSPSETPQFVFLGRLNVPHNDSAITSFLDQVGTALRAELPAAVVRIVGRGATASLRRVVAMHPRLARLEGHVDDLDALFATTTAMLAPLRYGTGVKVKVLEALARGLPVVGTERAFSGIPIELDGSTGCLVENDLRLWPQLLERVSDRVANGRLSRAAREFYLRTYDRKVVAQQYDQVFGQSRAPFAVADNGAVAAGPRFGDHA
jgi:glycosyltransferase involved in cell wall biosynthesis